MKNFPIIFIGLVIIALLVGILVWNLPSRTQLYDTSTAETVTPIPLAPEAAGIDDIAAEADTFDITFDADIQQLDAELKGL